MVGLSGFLRGYREEEPDGSAYEANGANRRNWGVLVSLAGCSVGGVAGRDGGGRMAAAPGVVGPSAFSLDARAHRRESGRE